MYYTRPAPPLLITSKAVATHWNQLGSLTKHWCQTHPQRASFNCYEARPRYQQLMIAPRRFPVSNLGWHPCLISLKKKLKVSVPCGATPGLLPRPVEEYPPPQAILMPLPASAWDSGLMSSPKLLSVLLTSGDGWGEKGPIEPLLTRPLISPQQYHTGWRRIMGFLEDWRSWKGIAEQTKNANHAPDVTALTVREKNHHHRTNIRADREPCLRLRPPSASLQDTPSLSSSIQNKVPWKMERSPSTLVRYEMPLLSSW